MRLANPLECESASLPGLAQSAADAIMLAVRTADSLNAARDAVDRLEPQSPSSLAPRQFS